MALALVLAFGLSRMDAPGRDRGYAPKNRKGAKGRLAARKRSAVPFGENGNFDLVVVVKTNKKVLCAAIGVSMSLLSLLGCGSNAFNSSSEKDRQLRDKTAYEIIDSVTTNNVDEFKSLLSENVASMDDIDEGFEYMVGLMQGSILEICDIVGGGSNGRFGDGEACKTLLGGYSVVAGSATYELDFELVVSSKDDEESPGVVFVKIFNEDLLDQGAQHRSSNMHERFGVYSPSWDQ